VLPPGRRRCATAAFTAVPMVEGINFCCGGFRVTTSLQVLDVFGQPIPGLFAAGDCVGGLNPVSDLGGIHICGGFTLGRVAGRSAARGVDDPTGHHSVLHAGMPSMLDTRIALVHLDGPGAREQSEPGPTSR
jgi:succinate dehydrogenase/fumarate reductase flavoprotein subunit